MREGHSTRERKMPRSFFFPSLFFLFLIRCVVGESSRHGRDGSLPWFTAERGSTTISNQLSAVKALRLRMAIRMARETHCPLPYTDCPPTRHRAARIKRKSHQNQHKPYLRHNRANFRIENQKRKEKKRKEKKRKRI